MPLSREWRARWRADTAFMRGYLWRYRKYVALGLFSLVLVDGLEVLPPIFLKQAVDTVIGSGPFRQIFLMAVAYLAVSMVQAVGRYGWRMFLVRSSLFAGRDIRARFTHHLFGLSSSFFDRSTIGELMSLSTSDTEAVRMAIGIGLLVFVDALFYFISVPLAMYYLSPKLTLIAFIPLPAIPLVVIRNQREIHVRYQRVQESFARISMLVQEGMSGIRVTRAFAREDAQLARLREAGREFTRLNLDLARVQTAFGPTLDFTMSLGLVLLLWFGGGDLVSGEADGAAAAITLGTFVAFQRYIQKMVWPMAAVGMAIGFYQRGVSSSARVMGILDVRSDVPDDAEPELPPSVAAPGAPYRAAGRVELRDLTFKFPGADRAVLSGITLTIEPGERVAFIGAVGSGKSALLSLLPRIYPVGRGMLWIDGVDVNRWPVEELRRQVGYVSQDVFLFSESVAANIAMGLREWVDDTAARAEPLVSVEDATRLAAVHEDVLGLSEGWKTRLGERGVNLSGGQKQRLTIARAIVRRPAILVLDDALSSVDVHTEERILGGLRARAGRNTEIIAAHRISTIRDANRIVVLDGGKLVQQGTHDHLLAQRGGLYRAYHDQQRAKEDLESYLAEGPAS